MSQPLPVSRTKKADLYKPNDTHWSEAGNALAAELLYRWLAPKTDTAL